MSVKPSIISHSEVDSFLSCERKHYYSFGYPTVSIANETENGLEPTFLSNGLFRGIMGHEVLEHYYKWLAPISLLQPPSDLDFAQAAESALAILPPYILANPDRMNLILDLRAICEAYFKHYREIDKQYQFIAVEVEFRQVIDETIEFPFKPDLIRRHRVTMKVEVVDHKFLANLYTAREIAIQPQMAKYVGSLRDLGYDVDDAVYDLICHRVLKTKPIDPEISFKRTNLHLTKARISQSQWEQNSVVRTIAKLKFSPSIWSNEVRRSATSYNCKNCSFLDLCVSELNGENIDVAVKTYFIPNSYGYDKKEASK